ncbi:hypothetical protein JCM1840_002972 [Sporobolomyces johnsonii]
MTSASSPSSAIPTAQPKGKSFPKPLNADIRAYHEDLKDFVCPELTEAEKVIVGDSFQTEMSKLHKNTINKTTGKQVSKSSLQAAEKKCAVYISKVLNGNKDCTQQEPDDVELCMCLAECDVPEFSYCVASDGGGAKGEGAWKSRQFVKLRFEGLVRKKRVHGKKAAQAGPALADADTREMRTRTTR